MNESLIKSLVDGVKLKRASFTDAYGNVISFDNYIKYCVDAVSIKQESRKIPYLYENPIAIQLELTDKCNQKCIHCYNQSGTNCESTKELTIDEWKNVANESSRMGVFQYIISGGEPTILGSKLFDIMNILHESRATFIFISNGMLINEENIENFAKYRYNWFQLSIDGSRPEIHDFIRGATSFNKVVKAANLVKQAGLPLVIAHCVMKRNIDDLEEMIDVAYLLGASRIIVGPFSNMGRAVLNNEDIAITQEEILRVYEIIEKKAIQYIGLMEVAIPAEEVFSLRTKLIEPNQVLLVRPNGDVKFDCVSPFTIGNVRQNTLREIWRYGKQVHMHPRLEQYVMQIKSQSDLLTVKPRINVDPDELLIFDGKYDQKGSCHDGT